MRFLGHNPEILLRGSSFRNRKSPRSLPKDCVYTIPWLIKHAEIEQKGNHVVHMLKGPIIIS